MQQYTRETDSSKWSAITGTPMEDGAFDNTVAIWHAPCGCWFEEFVNIGKTQFQVIIGNDGWLEDTADAAAQHLIEWHNSNHA